MEAELKILSLIGEESQNITQRHLSAKTDLSLGAINLLLKKMIDKGLIKIDRLNTRTVRYMLTPKGMLEKTKKTYDYIKRTYENILWMQDELASIVNSLSENSTLYLYGEEDEVYQMLIMLLRDITGEKGIAVKKIETLKGIDSKSTIVIWNESDEKQLAGAKCINILDRII